MLQPYKDMNTMQSSLRSFSRVSWRENKQNGLTKAPYLSTPASKLAPENWMTAYVNSTQYSIFIFINAI